MGQIGGEYIYLLCCKQNFEFWEKSMSQGYNQFFQLSNNTVKNVLLNGNLAEVGWFQ